jgi:hypothetical protein
MEPKTPNDESPDELLARYEEGVWTFIAIVGCMLGGIIVWVAFVML